MRINQTPDPRGSIAAQIITWSAENRVFVFLATVALVVLGTLAVMRLPLDAIPDLSDTQVIIRTEWPGQAPQVVEDQVTFPLASRMLGLPHTKAVRGFSMFGTSFVYIIFEEDTNLYWARSRVLEALSSIAPDLPEGARTELGPDATGVGWVFQYALIDRSGAHDLSELRSLQDWFVRTELEAVDGVAEVASVGGFQKEYQVLIDPVRLRAYGIPLSDVTAAIRGASGETGGRTIEMAEREYLVRAFGYVHSPEDLEQAVLRSREGTPVTLGDIARVVEGPSLRRGIAELDGTGEAVGGIVVMRAGANGRRVIADVKTRLERVRQGLPEGVELKAVYDRSTLIDGAISYLRIKLIEESLVVVLVAFLFLLHVRSALVAVITLPLGILGAAILMQAQGLTANIMSLGGIAIAMGAMVDASIVMVENAHRHLAALGDKPDAVERRRAILEAAREVGPGLFFSLLIITVSFLPVFALNGESYRLFAPLAFTKTYAMAVACLLSVTVVPVLMLTLLRGKMRREEDSWLNRGFAALYRPLLGGALRWRKVTLALALLALISTAWPLSKLGTEFMPPLDEGSLMYMPMTLPGVSITEARRILQVTNQQIMTVPEVAHVFGKAGRADTATDPAPLAMIETWIELTPREDWRPGLTMPELIQELNAQVGLPGLTDSWGYPIRIRLDMLSTGLRTPVGVKIAGPDLVTIDAVAREVEAVARKVPGTRSAIADRVQGGNYVEIHPDRQALARHGIPLAELQSTIATALGGVELAETVEGRARYPIIARYDRSWREHVSDLADLLVAAPENGQIPLADLADIQINDGPAMIRTEDARLTGWVFVDFADRDLGSYIDDLRARLAEIDLPAGTTFSLAGRWERMQEAQERLVIAVPTTILIIAILLYLHFGRWDRTLLILFSIPFAVIGGVWSIWLAGYHLSVAVAVGFIALAGVATETAIVMLIYIDARMRTAPPEDHAAFLSNIHYGALRRLRPKLMTVFTIVLALVPIFLTEGPGADVMRRIALPMIGGMASTTLLTLLLVPALYALWFGRGLNNHQR